MAVKTSAKQVSDMTVDELKSVIHEVITEDMDAGRETFEIMADKKLMRQIRQADLDWVSGAKDSYVSWNCPNKSEKCSMKGIEFYDILVSESRKNRSPVSWSEPNLRMDLVK